MHARKLTPEGIAQFESYLSELKDHPQQNPPHHLLTAADTSEPLDVDVDAAFRNLHSRLEMAEHLFRILRGDPATLRNDRGFWTWLSLSWFDELCPRIHDRRVPGNSVKWIADLESPRRTCQHLLAGPFQIYRAHRDDPTRAMSLLCGSIHQTGPLARLIASRPSLVTCHAVVGAATRLYYSHLTGRNRPGLSGRAAGSPTRFADVLSQLDLTWDLHSLSTDELLSLLPAEFDHFHREAILGKSRQKLLLD